MNLETLIDQIYEAGLVPEHWPTVLDRISEFANGDGGILLTGGMQHWVASEHLRESVDDYVAQGWPTRTDRADRLFSAFHYAGFISDLDVYTREEIEKEPVYLEFLRPRGYGWGAGTAIAVPSGDLIALDLERRYSRGPFEPEIIARLDHLRPHLARAALISGRLFLERIRSATDALDAIGLAAAVIGLGGKILVTNHRFERFMPLGARERRGKIEIVNPAANALLMDAISKIGPGGDPKSVRSIPVSGCDRHPPLIWHIVPIRGAAHDIFSGAQAILVITPLLPKVAPKAELLQGLFDLTPAESRVARAISQGRTINQIAVEFGLSRATIRTQVKSVLAKTGSSRQADLAVMLAATTLGGAMD